MTGIKCIAPVFDMSGYGEWSREYILTFIKAGLPITIGSDLVRKTGKPITFDSNPLNLSEDGALLSSYVDKKIEYDTVICWLTPEMAIDQLMLEPSSVKKIVMTLWETDTLPERWLHLLELVDEIWLPGQWNKEIFSRSIRKYADKYPNHSKLKNLPIKTLNFPFRELPKFQESEITGINKDTFVFYFISQWSERKNFVDLLEAYWYEFSRKDNVLLLLKTFLRDNSDEDKKYIYNQVEVIKRGTGLENPAHLAIIHGNLSKEDMQLLHCRGNCYVNPSHGEGLGLGMLKASLYEKPVITHTFGEQRSYYTEKNSYIYNHIMRPVRGVSNPILYKINQKWAGADVLDLGNKMRQAYENKEGARIKGILAKKDILEVCNVDSVIKNFISNLEN